MEYRWTNDGLSMDYHRRKNIKTTKTITNHLVCNSPPREKGKYHTVKEIIWWCENNKSIKSQNNVFLKEISNYFLYGIGTIDLHRTLVLPIIAGCHKGIFFIIANASSSCTLSIDLTTFADEIVPSFSTIISTAIAL